MAEFVYILSFYQYGHEIHGVYDDEATARRAVRGAFEKRAKLLGGSAEFRVQASRSEDTQWWFRGDSHTAIITRHEVIRPLVTSP